MVLSDQNLAFYDYLKPLGTIVGEAKFFHLRPLDMKSEMSGTLYGGYCPPKYAFSQISHQGAMLGGKFCEKSVENEISDKMVKNKWHKS